MDGPGVKLGQKEKKKKIKSYKQRAASYKRQAFD
jgi:hypothetical protein